MAWPREWEVERQGARTEIGSALSPVGAGGSEPGDEPHRVARMRSNPVTA